MGWKDDWQQTGRDEDERSRAQLQAAQTERHALRREANAFLKSPAARKNLKAAAADEQDQEVLDTVHRYLETKANDLWLGAAACITILAATVVSSVIVEMPAPWLFWSATALSVAGSTTFSALSERTAAGSKMVKTRLAALVAAAPDLQLTDPPVANHFASLLAEQGQALTMTSDEMDVLQQVTQEYNAVWNHSAQGKAVQELCDDLYEALLAHRSTEHRPRLIFPSANHAHAADRG